MQVRRLVQQSLWKLVPPWSDEMFAAGSTAFHSTPRAAAVSTFCRMRLSPRLAICSKTNEWEARPITNPPTNLSPDLPSACFSEIDAFKRHTRALKSRIRAPSPSTRNGPAFQYMSDLHLEVGQQYLSFDFDVTAPNLILAGDIGRLVDYDGYLSFLHKQIARYKHVFLVLGNHEFYGLSFQDGLARARALEREPLLEARLTLLQQDTFSFEDDGVAVVGCSLWSFIPEESAPAVKAVLNDFKQIQGWSIEEHNAAHSEDLAWLRQEVQRCKPHTRIIIVTHHAPLLDRTASPQHKDSPIKSAFATDLLCGTRADPWSQAKYWIFGHTHWTTNFNVEGTQVVSNQRGYVYPGNNLRLRVETHAPNHTFDAKRTIWL